jgi:hypothetical protein
MKKLLLMLIVSICAIAWRSEDILTALGMVKTASAPQSYSTQSLDDKNNKKTPTGISLTEYAELTKTDPEAYRKLFQSNQQTEQRSEVDKLMNFFAHLKYE